MFAHQLSYLLYKLGHRFPRYMFPQYCIHTDTDLPQIKLNKKDKNHTYRHFQGRAPLFPPEVHGLAIYPQTVK